MVVSAKAQRAHLSLSLSLRVQGSVTPFRPSRFARRTVRRKCKPLPRCSTKETRTRSAPAFRRSVVLRSLTKLQIITTWTAVAARCSGGCVNRSLFDSSCILLRSGMRLGLGLPASSLTRSGQITLVSSWCVVGAFISGDGGGPAHDRFRCASKQESADCGVATLLSAVVMLETNSNKSLYQLPAGGLCSRPSNGDRDREPGAHRSHRKFLARNVYWAAAAASSRTVPCSSTTSMQTYLQHIEKHSSRYAVMVLFSCCCWLYH